MTLHQQRCARKGEAPKIRPGGLMAPWTIEVKFLHDTQFLFGSLMFTTGEDRNLELLTRGPAPTHRKPVFGEALYYPTNPSASASSDAHSGLNPYEWSYYPSAMTSQGYLIGTPIFQPLARTSSSSSSGAFTDRDSIKDYTEIGGSAC
jgi:hypothetical protein